ncbi:MAG: PIN domain-containing protein [Acidimicrobiales bacterium]
MRIVVDTGVFSAALSKRRRARFEGHVALMAGHQVFLAAATASELRYGTLVAEWGPSRRARLEEAIQSTTVVPVTNALLTRMAELRYACRRAGHPLHESNHANDLWIAATAIHIGARLLTADAIFDATPGLTLHE